MRADNGKRKSSKAGGQWKAPILGVAVVGLFAVTGALFYYFRAGRDSGENAPGGRRLSITGAETGYVDSTLCAGCHVDIYKTYQHTGMARSFFRPRPEITIENYETKTFYHQASARYYTMIKRNGKYYQRRHQIGFDGRETNVVEKEVHYVVGSGNHARTYLHRTAEGKMVELPVAWYSANGGYWAMNPGYDRPDHQDFRRRVTYACMFCHNGYPEIEPGSDASGSDPIFKGKIPEGIDCQRCHGPGRDHIQAVQAEGATSDTISRSIVNPARLGPERQLEVCMQCHLESTSFRLPYSIVRYDRGVFSYRPGEGLAGYILHFDHPAGVGYDDKFEIAHQAYRLRKAACFQKSNGSMTCATCHNPHDVPRGERAIRHYLAVCQSCHSEALEKLVSAGRHTTSRDCLGCHMPKRRTDDVVHVVMTDHYIQRHRPARNLVVPVEEKHDTPEARYTGEVVLHYPTQLPQTPESELYLAVAQVKENSNLKAGIFRLEKAIERYHPEQGEFYFELAEAYLEAGETEKAIRMYEEVLRRKPNFRPALHRLGMALSKSGQLSRAAEVLERALGGGSQDATLSNDLALVYRQQGRLPDAVAVLRKAVALDTDFSQAYNNLGGALSEIGDRAGAEAAYRQAVRAQPDFAAAHTNLANLLAASGDFRQAEYHFEKAIQWAPKYAAAHYDYGLALSKRQRFEKAKAQLEEAVRLDPDLAEAHNVLGDLLAMKGEIELAIGRYRKAIEGRPESASAHFNLGSALASQGKRAEAKQHFQRAVQLNPSYYEAHLSLGHALAAERKAEEALLHFRKAAESSDPIIRQGALDSLKAVGTGRSSPMQTK